LQQQRCYLFFLLCVGLVGCSATMNYKGENKFKARIHAFSHAIRWSQFEEAQGFIRKRNNQAVSQNQDYFKQIKVIKYKSLSEISRKSPDQQGTDIVSTYTIDFYHKGTYKTQHQQYQQLWWYDDAADSWFLDSDLPNFRQ